MHCSWRGTDDGTNCGVLVAVWMLIDERMGGGCRFAGTTDGWRDDAVGRDEWGGRRLTLVLV